MDEQRRRKLRQRYEAALHAVQTGVAAWMQVDPSEIEPKHLRVGVNSALLDSAALVKLFIAKGVFTEEEYAEALVEAVEGEVRRYQEKLQEHYGTTFTLL